MWFGGYPAEWALIQNSYSSMAPKDLGSMGYVGLSTMYIPKPVQNQAYFASGTALQYYRDWNSSWNQVSDYFGAISAIETSKLVPCNASGNNLANDLIMRTYLKITGDVDGVLVTGDDSGRQRRKYVGISLGAARTLGGIVFYITDDYYC